MFKGCICPYCGKCFEGTGHLEKHKRVHTGEKLHRCETCGTRFSQKCSLKEHEKIHSRCIEPRPVEIPVREEKQNLWVDPCSEADGGFANGQDGAAACVQVKAEPIEESGTHRLFPKQEGDVLTETFGSTEWTEASGAEYPGGSGPTGFLPVPAEASCSTSSFPGKNGSSGSSDTVLPYTGSGSCAAEALNQSSACKMLKPTKCSACSYCGKLFQRSGHLERHLRIHTGEKPYGCHVCGRCFNQNSSLKGHMKTHRKPDVPTTHPIMFTVPDGPALDDPSDAPVLAASRHQVPGSMNSEAAAEHTVMVKAEDAGGAAVTPAPQLQDHQIPDQIPHQIPDQIPERDRTREELVSGFNAMASGNHQDARELKRFICSHCRQSFDAFSLFEVHRCKTATETSFACEICDKVFNHLSILKLHLKLHAI